MLLSILALRAVDSEACEEGAKEGCVGTRLWDGADNADIIEATDSAWIMVQAEAEDHRAVASGYYDFLRLVEPLASSVSQAAIIEDGAASRIGINATEIADRSTSWNTNDIEL